MCRIRYIVRHHILTYVGRLRPVSTPPFPTLFPYKQPGKTGPIKANKIKISWHSRIFLFLKYFYNGKNTIWIGVVCYVPAPPENSFLPMVPEQLSYSLLPLQDNFPNTLFNEEFLRFELRTAQLFTTEASPGHIWARTR